jgi:archaeal flagellar protein FlaI
MSQTLQTPKPKTPAPKSESQKPSIAPAQEQAPESDTLEAARARNAHLDAYLQELEKEGKPLPVWKPVLSRDMKSETPYNHLYPLGDPVFVHIVDDGGPFPRYHPIEPVLDEGLKARFETIRQRAFIHASKIEHPPEETDAFEAELESLVDKATTLSRTGRPGLLRRIRDRFDAEPPVAVNPKERDIIAYHLKRDIVHQGRMEPLMLDPNIEDIHGLGLRNVFCIHKIFGMLETGIRFPDGPSLDAYLLDMSERMGRIVSDTNPVVDGALPDGSRINIIFSDAISRGGSSFTIRKFSDVPLPVTQLVAWKTFSPHVAAYLWLCLETGMSIFVAGETASGKTTTLNSILPFIKPKSKILTAEDTPEVLPPHENWQQLVTRETGPEEARVNTHDLLKAALRSRPDYIIVGEIRGAEGAVAFQAMQTGHSTMATFHASSVGKLIQRFTSAPINVPAQFMDNLNVTLIQMAVYVGGKMLRRVLAVEEIEGYSKQTQGVVTRGVFNWNPLSDVHVFNGRNNSYILETLVADRLGLDDPREVYQELDKRARIIELMIQNEMFDYHEVQRLFAAYATQGEAALPFPVTR